MLAKLSGKKEKKKAKPHLSFNFPLTSNKKNQLSQIVRVTQMGNSAFSTTEQTLLTINTSCLKASIDNALQWMRKILQPQVVSQNFYAVLSNCKIRSCNTVCPPTAPTTTFTHALVMEQRTLTTCTCPQGTVTRTCALALGWTAWEPRAHGGPLLELWPRNLLALGRQRQ